MRRQLRLSQPGSLGEGDTPLISLSSSLFAEAGVIVRVKCEHLNPTGSFKDRIAAVAAELIRERDLVGCAGTSSGNGGAAIAAYGAHLGFPVTLFVVPGSPATKLAQARAYGAHVVELEGLGHDAAATEAAAATISSLSRERGLYPFVTARRFSPEAMRGAEAITVELAAQAPAATHIYVPVGGGGLLGSLGIGYRKLNSRGRPRLVAVQPKGCPTVRKALAGEPATLDDAAGTTVSGLVMASLFDVEEVVDAVQLSGGYLTEVSDEEIWTAQTELAQQHGILVEPAGATAFAGALADVRAGHIAQGDEVVVIASGAGWKDLVALTRVAGSTRLRTVGQNGIGKILDDMIADAR
jgi:threonine synthase